MKVNRLKAFNLLRPPFTSVQPPACGSSDGQDVRKLNKAPSTGLSKVPSLMFDLELEEGQAGKENHSEQADAENVLLDVRSLVDPWNHTEYNLQVHARVARTDLLAEGRSVEAADLAAKLRRLGHNVAVRTALGGGWGGACLRNLRHTFLTCVETDRSGRTTFIIDPKFKEQFEIAHPSKRYQAILEALPEVYVGTEERVEELVELLCGEISLAFKQAGATLPPWRHASSMLSKWRPRQSEDVRSAVTDSRTSPPLQRVSLGGFPSGGEPPAPKAAAEQHDVSPQSVLDTPAAQPGDAPVPVAPAVPQRVSALCFNDTQPRSPYGAPAFKSNKARQLLLQAEDANACKRSRQPGGLAALDVTKEVKMPPTILGQLQKQLHQPGAQQFVTSLCANLLC